MLVLLILLQVHRHVYLPLWPQSVPASIVVLVHIVVIIVVVAAADLLVSDQIVLPQLRFRWKGRQSQLGYQTTTTTTTAAAPETTDFKPTLGQIPVQLLHVGNKSIHSFSFTHHGDVKVLFVAVVDGMIPVKQFVVFVEGIQLH